MRNTPPIINKYKLAWRSLLAMSSLTYIFSASAFADERQYKIEAAYLYSFFNYITWPGYNSPQELQRPVICTYGNDPLIPYLDYVSNKMEEERVLRVRAVAKGTSTEDCHILFIRHQISYNIQSTLQNKTLVVFKPDDPLDRGGMIELTQDNERIAIKIDRDEVQRNGFQISSRLIELSQRSK